MNVQDLYHGAPGDNILSILAEGVIKPSNGEIYFIKNESQLYDGFQYGADISRGAAFVILAKAQVPDGLSPKRLARPGAPRDTWCFETNKPIKVEVLKLYVRTRPGLPIETSEGGRDKELSSKSEEVMKGGNATRPTSPSCLTAFKTRHDQLLTLGQD